MRATSQRLTFSTVETAGAIAVFFLAVVALFQLALAFGAPFGRAAWGGRNEGTLPGGLRIASAMAGLFLYPAVIAVVLSASGLTDTDLVPGRGDVLMWVLTVLFGVGGVANGASRSPLERWWAPVSLTVAACCAYLGGSL